MASDLRPYDRERDLDAVRRIWRDVGWVDSDEDEAALAGFLDGSNVEVAILDGAAECSVAWSPGRIRYQDTDLAMCVVTAVTTSRIARKHGFATSMTARAIKAGADAGAAVAALGMFEQGFYDRIGFGTAPYGHEVSFDPATLAVDHIDYRQPVRLTADDYEEMHQLVVRRHRLHGGVVVDAPPVFRAELEWVEKPFGLGYRNSDGRLTHFLYGEAKESRGPWTVVLMGYEEPHGLLELLRLLAELADQVTSITIPEPPEIQVQDVIRGPMRQRRRTKASPQEAGVRSLAWMQFRILDLEPVVAARSWPGPELRFNLALTDPAGKLLASSSEPGWNGIAGDYVITIGQRSSGRPGREPGLPVLSASVNAFSRCWFGVRPASSLALVDDLDAADELLHGLDEALALPTLNPGWEF